MRSDHNEPFRDITGPSSFKTVAAEMREGLEGRC